MSRPIWYDSDETGAPTLNNAAGSLLEVLRACLVGGFNLKTVTSIVVASGVATATAATHGYSGSAGKLLRIEGAPVAGLNGDVQPSGVTTNTFTYPAPGVADGTYTGTITARRAPLGWMETFSGTNKAIFRRSAPAALDYGLRVDNSATGSVARVLGVSGETGVDSYTFQVPTEVQFAGGLPWQGGANTATAKKWALFGDERAFFLATQLGTTDNYVVYFAGDGLTYGVGDARAFVVAGQTQTTVSTTPTWSGLPLGSGYASNVGSSSAMYVAGGSRPGDAAALLADCPGMAAGSGTGSLQDSSVYTNVALQTAVHFRDASKCVRGEVPGLAWILAAAPFSPLEVVQANGSQFVAIPFASSGVGGGGQLAIRVSGVWH